MGSSKVGHGRKHVLVGPSGGGFITAGYASAHADDLAGMLLSTPAPATASAREIVEATDRTNPESIERRDCLQVERDAWAARRGIGDLP